MTIAMTTGDEVSYRRWSGTRRCWRIGSFAIRCVRGKQTWRGDFCLIIAIVESRQLGLSSMMRWDDDDDNNATPRCELHPVDASDHTLCHVGHVVSDDVNLPAISHT
jgi:hypothetical protein